MLLYERRSPPATPPNRPGTPTDTFWIYDGDQAVLEFDGDTAADLSHRYLWGDAVDQLLADETVDDGGTEDVLWPLTDWQGTVRDLAAYDTSTDTTSIANHKVYDAYGNVYDETDDTVDTLFGYTGRMWDDDTALQNNLNRWYDPATARWLSEDPIGFTAGAVDPSGLEDTYGIPTNISLTSNRVLLLMSDAVRWAADQVAHPTIETTTSR